MHSAILATAASLAATGSPAAPLCVVPAALPCPAREGGTLPDGTVATLGSDMDRSLPASRASAADADLSRRKAGKTGKADAGLRRPDWPVASMQISSRYGRRLDPIERDIRLHAGIDIAGLKGTPVRATAGGWIAQAGTAGGYGQLVQIDHGNGVVTRYGHLDRIVVTRNSHVERGQLIAYMGSTGRSTGNHLHFEVRDQGRAVDPLLFLAKTYMFTASFPTSHSLLATPATPHLSAFARQRGIGGLPYGSGLDLRGED